MFAGNQQLWRRPNPLNPLGAFFCHSGRIIAFVELTNVYVHVNMTTEAAFAASSE